MDALGGVLCRCTGYRKIVEAVLDLAGAEDGAARRSARAVGARLGKVDGPPKLTGAERYGADGIPARRALAQGDPLAARLGRASRSAISTPLLARHPGLLRVLTAADVPANRFGIYPHLKDQPVLADGIVRYRGEAVAALLGERAALEAVRERRAAGPLPSRCRRGRHRRRARSRRAAGPGRQARQPADRGRGPLGRWRGGARGCAAVAEGEFTTPSSSTPTSSPRPAGRGAWATASRSTSPRSRPTWIATRPRACSASRPSGCGSCPTACGGGFGGKLDLSVQPLLALAASLTTGRSRSSTSGPRAWRARPSATRREIRARLGCDAEGRLVAFASTADFDTGAYASWGPTVAGRVPVHAMGPYRVPHVAARGRALSPTRRRPAPSAASACPRPRSPTRR